MVWSFAARAYHQSGVKCINPATSALSLGNSRPRISPFQRLRKTQLNCRLPARFQKNPTNAGAAAARRDQLKHGSYRHLICLSPLLSQAPVFPNTSLGVSPQTSRGRAAPGAPFIGVLPLALLARGHFSTELIFPLPRLDSWELGQASLGSPHATSPVLTPSSSPRPARSPAPSKAPRFHQTFNKDFNKLWTSTKFWPSSWEPHSQQKAPSFAQKRFAQQLLSAPSYCQGVAPAGAARGSYQTTPTARYHLGGGGENLTKQYKFFFTCAKTRHLDPILKACL